MADITQVSANAVASAGHTFDAINKSINDKAQDARLALEHASRGLATQLTASNIFTQAAGAFLSILADLATVGVAQITNTKENASVGSHDLIASLLSDALLIDINPTDIPAANGSANAGAVNAAIGKKFLDALKGFMNASGTVDANSAETAVQSLMGLGMQMSVNTAILGVIGGAVPGGFHLDDVKELGEMLEKSLGLGRLVRQFLAPYIQVLVQQPLKNSLQAQYRTALLGVGELAKAVWRNADDDQWRTLLTQHGYSDVQIAELLAQHAVRVNESDEDLLGALGTAPPGDDFYESKQNGAAPEVRTARLAAVTWKRLNHARERVLSLVLSQISQGFLQPSDLEPAMTQLGIPADEQALWRIAAGYAGERTRKRMSQGDMEFLYEAAQINQGDVLAWAASEGYSAADQQRNLLLFELKATAATAKSTGGAAAKAAARHAEHVAYITDEITGLWGRAPNTAELDYWVALLDTGARTKADAKTELKALPTTGP